VPAADRVLEGGTLWARSLEYQAWSVPGVRPALTSMPPYSASRHKGVFADTLFPGHILRRAASLNPLERCDDLCFHVPALAHVASPFLRPNRIPNWTDLGGSSIPTAARNSNYTASSFCLDSTVVGFHLCGDDACRFLECCLCVRVKIRPGLCDGLGLNGVWFYSAVLTNHSRHDQRYRL
jgi:hypothetical protein